MEAKKMPVVIRKENGEFSFPTEPVVLKEVQEGDKTVYISELQEKIPTRYQETDRCDHRRIRWKNAFVCGEELFLYRIQYDFNDEQQKVQYGEPSDNITQIYWCNQNKMCEWPDDKQRIKFLQGYPYLECQEMTKQGEYKTFYKMIGQSSRVGMQAIFGKICKGKLFIFGTEHSKVCAYYSYEQNDWINFEKSLSNDIGIFYQSESVRFCDSETGKVYDENGKEVKN